MYSENLAYIESLLKEYQDNPQNTKLAEQFPMLAEEPKRIHKALVKTTSQDHSANLYDQLVQLYRKYGFAVASLSPIETEQSSYFEFFEQEKARFEPLKNQTITHPLQSIPSPCTVAEMMQKLDALYCNHINLEATHVQDPEEQTWLYQQYESLERQSSSAEEKQNILQYLMQAEELEKYLHKQFVGQKRFSLEGTETLIPVIYNLLQHAATRYHTKNTIVGMAHRGRVNMLTNILGKPAQELFDEFNHLNTINTQVGDVKYHLGRSADMMFEKNKMRVSLLFNPSHLAIVTPLVAGKALAIKINEKLQANEIIPVTIHGDSAFCGQGVVMETLALSQTEGYSSDGCIHIIVNNQIGFTTNKIEETRSSFYCTDIAKMTSAPVLHVNATDPEAAIFAIKLAVDYRMQFKKDIVVDLIGWRKYGHNEADDPTITQPLMYQRIKTQDSIQKQYAEKIYAENIVNPETHEKLRREFISKLQAGKSLQSQIIKTNKPADTRWKTYINFQNEVPDTSVSKKTLKTLNHTINTLPDGFTPHTQIKKIYESRIKMLDGNMPIDWGCAENMAYATLVAQGYRVRISGQDSIRGTFAHRHSSIFDQTTNQTHCPIHNICEDKNQFKVINSTLSELAVCGFEYGYSIESPNNLVVWEAQFGDFVNGAQIVIDQFLSSASAKWNILSGLVLLLPHGYEGQGAEHSSARPERFLQLCAMHNMYVCYPSNSSQIFHLLRRQMLVKHRRPLVVMSPKSLLRKTQACCEANQLINGQFEEIIHHPSSSPAKQLVLCSGKIFYEIQDALTDRKLTDVAVIRIEQLYPLNETALKKLAKQYQQTIVTWCQEEPENQGFWWFIRSYMYDIFGKQVRYIGRQPSAVTACGSPILHKKEQTTIIDTLLEA